MCYCMDEEDNVVSWIRNAAEEAHDLHLDTKIKDGIDIQICIIKEPKNLLSFYSHRQTYHLNDTHL